MKSKILRNAFVFAALCFLIGSCIFMSNNHPAALLNLINAILFLVSAYIQHKKYKETSH